MVLLGLVLALVFVNLVTTRRLWASAVYETSQQVAQTVLLWLIPGSFIVVWYFLREPRADTQSGPAAAADWLSGAREGSTHTGSDGSHHNMGDGHHHSGGDGGGHHGGNGGHGGG